MDDGRVDAERAPSWGTCPAHGSRVFRFEVTRERIAAYAAATNDPIPAHASGEIAPPVFAIVPAFKVAGMASMQVDRR